MTKPVGNSGNNYLNPLEVLKKDESLFYTLYGPKIRQGLNIANTVFSYLAPVVPSVLIGAYAMRIEAITERVVPGLIASVAAVGLFFLTYNAICNLDGIEKRIQKSCIKTKSEIDALLKSVNDFLSDDIRRTKFTKVAKYNKEIDQDSCGVNTKRLLSKVQIADCFNFNENPTPWTETLSSLRGSLNSLLKAHPDVDETHPLFLNKGTRELLEKFNAQVETELPKLEESKKVLRALSQLQQNKNVWAISQNLGIEENELEKWKEFAESETKKYKKDFGKLEKEDLEEKIIELGYRIIVELLPPKSINNINLPWGK